MGYQDIPHDIPDGAEIWWPLSPRPGWPGPKAIIHRRVEGPDSRAVGQLMSWALCGTHLVRRIRACRTTQEPERVTCPPVQSPDRKGD